MKLRGRSLEMYCIAHIWCWPTPVVTITSSPAVSAWSVSTTLLRLEPLVALAVAERELLAPGAELCEPGLRRGRALGAMPGNLRGERVDGLRERADNRDVRVAQLRDLGRVDVEMHDGRARCERRELPGDAVVEARADRDEDVARVHREVRPLRPVHAGPAEVELVRLGERALAHQRRDDRERPCLGQREQLGARVAVERRRRRRRARACGRSRSFVPPRGSGAGAPSSAASSRAGRRAPDS